MSCMIRRPAPSSKGPSWKTGGRRVTHVAVVTRNAEWRHEGVEAVTSLEAAIALHAETSSLTAIANDYGGDEVFGLLFV